MRKKKKKKKKERRERIDILPHDEVNFFILVVYELFLVHSWCYAIMKR